MSGAFQRNSNIKRRSVRRMAKGFGGTHTERSAYQTAESEYLEQRCREA